MNLKFVLLFLVFTFSCTSIGQNVFKTPSGSKYHTSTCRSLKNVSSEISLETAKKQGLGACSICKPISANNTNNNSQSLGFVSSKNNTGIQNDELLGEKNIATQCTSKTKAGSRCKNKTKNANGRCYKHDN